jgi:branched-chain amino acid transport system substrate-binding protein
MALKKRGLQEVLYLEWDLGNREFSAIANRIKDVRPDLIWAGVLGVEGILLLEAMQKIDYEPPVAFPSFPCTGSDREVAGHAQRAFRDDLRGASALHQ